MSPDQARPYPEYKDSGVEWLGEVPAHWEVRKIKHWLALNQSTLSEETDPDYAFDYLDIGSVGTGRLLARPERTRFGSAPTRARRIVKSGDTIVSTVRTYLKAVWHVEGVGPDLIASTGFAVLTPKRCVAGVFPKYVSYWCQSEPFTDWVTANSIGIAYPAIAETKLAAINVAVPPLSEQTAITRYLDHATSRIDRYICAKEKLIALLEEQKQALIHEAVTGRIDVRTGKPYPAYKDSSVEWLGQVPEHWKVRRLQTVADMRVSNVDKHTREDEQSVRLCNYVDVYKNDKIRVGMDFMWASATREEIDRFRLCSGDVLITKDSEAWDDIGVPALVEDIEGDVVSGYHLALLRPKVDLVRGAFLFRALQTLPVTYQFHTRANGVTRYGLSHQAIKSTRMALPPLPEQAAIARYLDHANDNIDREIRATEKLIVHAHEYRTRLIADVVTGKLDVREAAAALPDADPP